jgi:DNA-binding response OmpR family regulator
MAQAAPVVPKRVLFVSRDQRLIDQATYAFGDDVEVLFASDARDAEEMLAKDVPTAVVVDLATGKAGGYALARDMSQLDSLKDVPVMILLEREQDRWLASSAGATAVRTKPIDPAHLAVDVRALFPN